MHNSRARAQARNAVADTAKELKMKNWCQETIETLELKIKNGYPLTQDEYEDYYYAKNVIQSEEAEIAYLNGEENY